MPDFMKMFEQAQQMQSRLQQVQDDLEKTTVSSSLADVTGGLNLPFKLPF